MASLPAFKISSANKNGYKKAGLKDPPTNYGLDSSKEEDLYAWKTGRDSDFYSNNNNTDIVNFVNKIDKVITYLSLSFSKTKLHKCRNIAGSRRSSKQPREEDLVPIVVITLSHKSKEVKLKALLDSGAGATLIEKKTLLTMASWRRHDAMENRGRHVHHSWER